MKIAIRFFGDEMPCSYLPTQTERIEYLRVNQLDPREYQEFLLKGWRRFGRTLFQPQCRFCNECKSLRINVAQFQPNRSMRRLERRNQGQVSLQIRMAGASPEPQIKELFNSYHQSKHLSLGWPTSEYQDGDYYDSFLNHPFSTEEWIYSVEDKIVAVSYVDALPDGLSAIYCFYEPERKADALGIWNVLTLIKEAKRRGLAFVYLGFYVSGCQSLAYKSQFQPNQVLDSNGRWLPHSR